MGFFSRVEYPPASLDDSWASKCETVADVLRAPSQWVLVDWFNVPSKISLVLSGSGDKFVSVPLPDISEGYRMVIRDIIGVVCGIFGQLLALPFMAFAFTNEEIRLKHRMASRSLTIEENKKLNELIKQRQDLANDRQGFDPCCITPLLCSIACSLCWILCCRS